VCVSAQLASFCTFRLNRRLQLLMLCVVIVFTVITVGLVILSSQKSKESMPKEKDVNSIYQSLKISTFFLSKDFVF
jgi:preprotein translocase subunit SecG